MILYVPAYFIVILYIYIYDYVYVCVCVYGYPQLLLVPTEWSTNIGVASTSRWMMIFSPLIFPKRRKYDDRGARREMYPLVI